MYHFCSYSSLSGCEIIVIDSEDDEDSDDKVVITGVEDLSR